MPAPTRTKTSPSKCPQPVWEAALCAGLSGFYGGLQLCAYSNLSLLYSRQDGLLACMSMHEGMEGTLWKVAHGFGSFAALFFLARNFHRGVYRLFTGAKAPVLRHLVDLAEFGAFAMLLYTSLSLMPDALATAAAGGPAAHALKGDAVTALWTTHQASIARLITGFAREAMCNAALFAMPFMRMLTTPTTTGNEDKKRR